MNERGLLHLKTWLYLDFSRMSWLSLIRNKYDVKPTFLLPEEFYSNNGISFPVDVGQSDREGVVTDGNVIYVYIISYLNWRGIVVDILLYHKQ